MFLHACVSDEPVISIDGEEEVICGITIRFKVNVEPANTTEWLVNWQKNRTGATELIGIRNKKYIGSHDRQLVINCVEKEDEGKYQAFLSRESNGKIYKIFSNCIYLLPQKGTLFCCTKPKNASLKNWHSCRNNYYNMICIMDCNSIYRTPMFWHLEYYNRNRRDYYILQSFRMFT